MPEAVSEQAFELYKHYIALKNHFTTESYDYFVQGGRSSSNLQSFANRKDIESFLLLSKKKNPKEYIFANILNKPTIWITNMVRDKIECDKAFDDWERRMQSLTYIFKEDVSKMLPDFESNFITEGGSHPPLLRLFMPNKISIETMTIIDTILNFTKLWDKKMKDDPTWKERSIRIRKYKPFLDIDLPKFKSILKDRFL